MAKQKPVWVHHSSQQTAQANISFCAGRDVVSIQAADADLVLYDIWTNLAHNEMLLEQNILNQEEACKIFSALLDLKEKVEKNEFELDPELEDVHINVESYVNEYLKENVSGKMHTARSRNDQVTCDLRLYLRDQVLEIAGNLGALIQSILDQAKQCLNQVMPGITHFQPAIVSTYAHFLTSYSQGLLRDLQRFEELARRLNINPLGAAASYGTAWPIDRNKTADSMGFNGVQENSLDCITNRWEFEAECVSHLSFLVTHLSIIAQDFILFSSPYVGYLVLDDGYVTGSSIMPQKRNPDFAEITKGKASYISSQLQALLGICKGMNSGYNRETQWVKYIVMDSIRECKELPIIFSGVFQTLKTCPEKMLENCRVGFINAVDFADFLASEKGLTFREAYHIVGQTVNQNRELGEIQFETVNQVLKSEGYSFSITKEDYERLSDYSKILSEKNSQGGPAPKQVEELIELQSKQLSSLDGKIKSIYDHVSTKKEEFYAKIEHFVKNNNK